ncbi:N-acylneuraminate-9-phosphatase isoform X2 [Denticeps clupeoides]|uniref:N-acylneuraminate-9-phosphatase isoform X2 n=1 Tax=Denticeps clupeoides TaxID=299321 RepID=UPI0010A33093|nr:N-acylneuraminate-9-phosphatase isoform X2 [Denticeps clupeoides]
MLPPTTVCELLKTCGGHDAATTGDVCQRFAHKLLQEVYEPSQGRSIDDVRADHWREAIQEAAGSDPGRDLAARCYRLWKETRLQLLALTPEVRGLLLELGRSYKLLLLTNGESQTQREKIRAVACEGLFSQVVVGGEHAEEKPAPSIFSHCFQLLAVRPQDCIMVGDSLHTDILGGINAGVRATVWVNGTGADLPEGPVKPDYTITSVLDLPKILEDFT